MLGLERFRSNATGDYESDNQQAALDYYKNMAKDRASKKDQSLQSQEESKEDNL